MVCIVSTDLLDLLANGLYKANIVVGAGVLFQFNERVV